MKQIKWISLLLMLAMVITACATVQQLPSGGTGNETDHNTDGQETVEVDLPDNLTYDGETIRLYTCENTLGVSISDFSEENATDVVTSALHNRMLNIEDRLGVTFELINTDVHTEMADIVSASIGSDSDDFDMVFSPALNIVGLVQQGMFIGIEELPYIDLEKPWWGSDYIRSVSVNQDYPYIMFGDINWNYLQRCTATFVNLRLLDDTLHMTSADMYNLVFNDEWTQDKMFELQSGVYSDVDGSTTRNEGDIFGFVHCGNWFFEYMMFGSGLTFTGRDNNGYGKRRIATSYDGGETWEDFRVDDHLLEDTFIGCNASLIRVERQDLSNPEQLPADADGVTIFCNPFSEKRINMTLNVSFDGGKTWAFQKTVHPDSSVYSSLVFSPKDQRFYLLYEKGTKTVDIKYGITAVEFDLEWLLA